MTKRESQKADYEAEVTNDGFDKAAYETRLSELQRMEPPTQTCRTCHWWHLGDCVLHTGLNGSSKAKLMFTGILRTAADFGCSEWRKDDRN